MKFGLKTLLLATVVFFGTQLQAQTMADAVAAYNKGANLQATDMKGSIKALEECVSICEKIGTEADSLKGAVSGAIPKLYVKLAADLVSEKKYTEAITAYEDVVKASEKYGDNESAESAKALFPQLNYAAGFEAYNQKNDASAVTYLEKSLSLDAANAKTLYLLAVVYQRMKDEPKFVETLSKLIETSKTQNDNASLEKANKLGKRYFTVAYSNDMKANKLNDAIESLKKAVGYDPTDKDLMFFLGQAYNKAKQYDLAIETLKNAVTLETGSADAKAKYYYELGSAYASKNDNANACDSYKNAQYGKYAENAKYQITTVLKCN